MKRFDSTTPASFDATMAKARDYAEAHPDEPVEVHLGSTGYTLTGSMPLVPSNVTIFGGEEGEQ